jgi:hypothetical protein
MIIEARIHMLDILPPRELNEGEIEKISGAVDEFVNVYERDGCISFIAAAGDDGAVGYQWVLFKDKWVETVVAEPPYDMDTLIDDHIEKVSEVMRQMELIDQRKGNEYPYMEAGPRAGLGENGGNSPAE